MTGKLSVRNPSFYFSLCKERKRLQELIDTIDFLLEPDAPLVYEPIKDCPPKYLIPMTEDLLE